MFGTHRQTSVSVAAERKTLQILLGTVVALGLLWASIGPARAMPDLRDEIECLALNIYFEARGEPKTGKLAVGHVVLNRVSDERFPTSVCDVVRQGGEKRRHRCQFSWWCDGRSDEPEDYDAWKASQALARDVFWGFANDPTSGALWYHATYVKPIWRKSLVRGPLIGDHQFYHGKAAGQVEAALH